MSNIQVMPDGAKQIKDMKLDSDSLIYNQHRFHTKQLSYQAPIAGTVYGVLLNDKRYVQSMDKAFHQAPYNNPPVHPVMYLKPINTINGHLKAIPMPKGETVVQINAAVGMVIGKTAVNVTVEDALDYVSGYTIVNDVSIPHNDFHRPNIKNKVRDGFCPIGPWIMEKKAIPNPNALTMRVNINEEIKQEIHTKHVVREAANLLSEISEFMTLTEGDVLLLGIFDGAPHAQIGDTVRIDVEKIGSLENTIVSEVEWTSGGDVS